MRSLKLSEEAEQKMWEERERKAKQEKNLKRALALLAIRWHGEIVGEKSCLLCAGVIAVLHFGDSVSVSGNELIAMGVVFFVIEAIVDCVFVWLVDSRLQVIHEQTGAHTAQSEDKAIATLERSERNARANKWQPRLPHSRSNNSMRRSC